MDSHSILNEEQVNFNEDDQPLIQPSELPFIQRPDAKKVIYITLFLTVIGFGVSIFLTYQYYHNGPTFCDISPSVSCSTVSHSEFGILFGVPVAILGISYFLVIFLILLCLIYTNRQAFVLFFCFWCFFGGIFLIYLLLAEILLQTICIFCTIIHIDILLLLISCWKLWRIQTEYSFSFFCNSFCEEIKNYKYYVIGLFAFYIILFTSFILYAYLTIPSFNIPPEFAKCLTQHNIVMYGSNECQACLYQKRIFGESFDYIFFIDCDTQSSTCNLKNIEYFPTWIRFSSDSYQEESKRHIGVMFVDDLEKFGYPCKIHNNTKIYNINYY